MNKCRLCPRNCGIDRTQTKGFCGEKTLRVSHVMLHHWEEPEISGNEQDCGSGTIFFTGCNLKCAYCQNWEISNNGVGKNVSVEDLVEIFKVLEAAGALNINLVTPTHFVDEILSSLKIYKPKVPVVWNTSGYESVETIEKLKGFVDVFLTDIKYFSPELSKKYSAAENYFKCASAAIVKMRDVVGEDIIVDGLMKKGIIVRHMVLPKCSSDSIKVLDWIKETLGTTTILSIMNQYTPCFNAKMYPEINQKVPSIEYKRVVNYAITQGFTKVYAQEECSANAEFIPEFKGFKPFGY